MIYTPDTCPVWVTRSQYANGDLLECVDIWDAMPKAVTEGPSTYYPVWEGQTAKLLATVHVSLVRFAVPDYPSMIVRVG